MGYTIALTNLQKLNQDTAGSRNIIQFIDKNKFLFILSANTDQREIYTKSVTFVMVSIMGAQQSLWKNRSFNRFSAKNTKGKTFNNAITF